MSNCYVHQTNMLFLVPTEINVHCLNWSNEACFFFRFYYIGDICHILYFHVYLLQTTWHLRGVRCLNTCYLAEPRHCGSKVLSENLKLLENIPSLPKFNSISFLSAFFHSSFLCLFYHFHMVVCGCLELNSCKPSTESHINI